MKPAERTALIARHNLWVSLEEIQRIKRAILEGDLWELVERRCRAHPALLSALRRLGKHQAFLERYEPLSRDNSMLYTGPETLTRPAFLRYEQRFFERYQYPGTEVMVAFEDAGKPYGRHYQQQIAEVLETCDAHFFVASAIGAVPIELDEMYPIAQSLFPDPPDLETKERIREQMEHLSHEHPYALGVAWDGQATIDTLAMMCQKAPSFDMDTARVRAVADYQFGKGAADILLDGQIELKKSETTGKIRNVLVDKQHILSMRANDGFFTLRPPGAVRLMKGFPAPALRVTVKDDAIPFNREGKNVFCSFVEECDPEVRPMDEVLVVDRAGRKRVQPDPRARPLRGNRVTAHPAADRDLRRGVRHHRGVLAEPPHSSDRSVCIAGQ
jgi:7-cyano-7-deazaguanine tRNA-ribosyltransferase